jgi:hypothetical protein
MAILCLFFSYYLPSLHHHYINLLLVGASTHPQVSPQSGRGHDHSSTSHPPLIQLFTTTNTRLRSWLVAAGCFLCCSCLLLLLPSHHTFRMVQYHPLPSLPHHPSPITHHPSHPSSGKLLTTTAPYSGARSPHPAQTPTRPRRLNSAAAAFPSPSRRTIDPPACVHSVQSVQSVLLALPYESLYELQTSASALRPLPLPALPAMSMTLSMRFRPCASTMRQHFRTVDERLTCPFPTLHFEEHSTCLA